MSATRSNLNNDNLISVIQVFRHGLRTPVYNYPNDPYKDDSYPSVLKDMDEVIKQDKILENSSSNYPRKGQSIWPVGPGKLLEKGIQQCYDLGQFTSKRYKNLFLSQSLEEHFRCYTTDYERTRLSAKAFISGFFQSLKEISPLNADLSIFGPVPMQCYTFKRSVDCESNKAFKETEGNYNDIIKYIELHSGFSITDMMHFYILYEILLVETTLGYELPEWTKSIYPKPLAKLVKMWMETLSATDQLKRLASGLFLNYLVKHFETILENPSSCQMFVAYCGHDLNIHTILNTLGHPVDAPPYCSSILFELRKSSSGQAYVNIYYKGEELIPITLPGGSFDCNLNDFKNFLSTYLIDFDSFTIECSSEGTKK